MKKRPDGTIDYSADPAVKDELERGYERQARARLPKEQQRAARQREIDAGRNRRNIDIPPFLESQVEKMAAQLEVPFSQLLCRLAVEGLKTLDEKALEEERQPTRSMRFGFTLPLEKRNRGNVR